MNAMKIITMTQDEFQILLGQEIGKAFESFAEKFQKKSNDEYLTRKQVAELLDIDLSTLHSYCKTGKLNPRGIGRRVYFLRSEVESSLIKLRN
ncbi:helix-turn-helix domain-containing protein [Flavobacterium sp.]|uniref:helix-turn-helix domain-containing protein n=1 Tax=Flavobacterium sp. TaxID=239 RepID=UPI0012273897|nr:helix-turn-helix domain-containing protein [Flavobacterium sp.]RZJ71549.1 MAG: DNA-binding protein [Flavobacterium sp.]